MEIHIHTEDDETQRTVIYGGYSAYELDDPAQVENGVKILWPDDIDTEPLQLADATITSAVDLSQKSPNPIAVDLNDDAANPEVDVVVGMTDTLPQLQNVVNHHLSSDETIDNFEENITLIR